MFVQFRGVAVKRAAQIERGHPGEARYVSFEEGRVCEHLDALPMRSFPFNEIEASTKGHDLAARESQNRRVSQAPGPAEHLPGAFPAEASRMKIDLVQPNPGSAILQVFVLEVQAISAPQVTDVLLNDEVIHEVDEPAQTIFPLAQTA